MTTLASPKRVFLSVGELASIAIRNQGMVPEEIMGRFFDKYMTCGRRGGTGLGTYSARLMAETQKGHIVLQSSGGRAPHLPSLCPWRLRCR